MIELKPLSYFYAVFQSLSFRVAAEDLGVAVSSLSESIKSLEVELGMHLFERTGRGLQPTEPAYWLFREAFKILNAELFTASYVENGIGPPRTISVHLDQGFSRGRLPTALLRAVRATNADAPESFFMVDWIGKRKGAPTLKRDAPSSASTTKIEILYADSEAIRKNDRDTLIIGVDSLVLLGQAPLIPASQVYHGEILVPNIPGLSASWLTAKLRKRNKLHYTQVADSEHLLEVIIALLSDHPSVPVLVPSSCVPARLHPIRNLAQPLVPSFELNLIAAVTGANSAALAFVARLRDALAHPDTEGGFHPVLTARQLNYFKLFQKTGSISQSAIVAGVAQPAVTAQLRKLQRCFTQPLLERSANRLRLTGDGHRFSEASDFLANSLSGLLLSRPQTARSVGSRIELGILPGVGPNGFLTAKVAEAIEAWRITHPGQRLRISEEPNDKLRSRIRRGTLHLGVITVKSPDLARFEVGSSESLALVYHPKSEFALPIRHVNFEELTALPLVLPTKQFGLRQLVDAAGRACQILLRPIIEVESLSMCVAMVRGGRLATILPPSDIQGEARSGDLRFNIIVNPSIVRSIKVIYSTDRELTLPERDLVSLLLMHLRDLSG